MSVDATPVGHTLVIELRSRNAESLLSELDPAPLVQRQLSQEAADYLLDRACTVGTRRRTPVRLVLFLDEPLRAGGQAELEAALRHAFTLRAESTREKLRALFREGWRTVAISLAVIAILAAAILAIWGDAESTPLAALGFATILSWVVIWRPAEIFLYDWWPIRDQERFWRGLADSAVAIQPLDSRSAA